MARRVRRRRRSRRRSRRSKTALRISKRQARTRRIDNRSEAIVALVSKRIAKAEIAKQSVTLINRQFLFGTYNAVQNLWNGAHRLDWAGTVIPVSQIPQTDIELSAANFAGADIPETLMTDESNPPVGIAMGHTVQTKHGKRNSDFIKANGFSLYLRGYSPRTSNPLPLMDAVVIRWRLVSLRCEDVHVAGFEPTAEEVMPWNSAGYSPKLDIDEAQLRDDRSYRVLAKGSMALKVSTLKSDVKTVTRFRSFKSPQLITYKPGDMQGRHYTKRALFLVFRSNVPLDTNYEDYRPSIQCVSKLFYKDA